MTRSPKSWRPEVLAPAGDRASLEAAVRAGADAVYFGLQGFNARARAANFDVEELGRTMRWLHEHDARGYVTLNTLVFDEELESVERAIRACAEAGVDAVIVQDLGVAKLARALAPELPVHASTQMTCTDAASVELARELGATRVILARELSLDDIAKIRAGTDVEVEVFVHGALCISYSGQCLTSEAIGGRSANRGACAQACRLPYELVVDGERADTAESAYLLSPEDLESSRLVPDLVKLGVASLKIEGRLKGPEYVAATTRLYRKAIDAAVGAGEGPTEDERRDALQTFTRGSGPGFFPGVDHQRLVEGRSCDHRGLPVGALERIDRARGRAWLVVKLEADVARGDGLLVEGGFASEGEIGGRVWAIEVAGKDVESARGGAVARLWLGPDATVGDVPPGVTRRVHRTSAPGADKRILARDAAERKTRIALRVAGRFGEPFVLEGRTSRGAYARVTGDAPVEEARSAPLDEGTLRDKLGRLGDSPFELGELEVALPPGSIVPLSSLNRARRALVTALVEAAPPARAWATTSARFADLVDAAAVPERAPPSAGLFVLCRTLEQATSALAAGAAGVYLDFLELTGTGVAVRALRAEHAGAFVGVAPPRIRKPGEEKVDRYIASLAPDAVLVRGLGALRELGRGDAAQAIGDFSLNVTNRVTAAEVLSRGLHAFTPSFDLDAAQLLALARTPFGPWMETVLHHPMALFHMEHCVIAALLSDGRDYKTCGRPCEKHQVALRDRAGMDHPVEADVGCRNTVFHARPQSAVQLLPELVRAGVRRFRVELVRETAADVGRLVEAYRRAIDDPARSPAVWKELRTEGGYGVVKGSLRVIP
ncbi:MAG: U32 family peptidase [Labilithrix sp.]|nr:U32 family peptidase [Labilithrix sp.]